MTESDSIGAGITEGTPDGGPPPQGEPPAFKDRKVGLVVFGALQLLLAVGFLGMAALQLFMVFAGEALAPGGGATPRIFAGTAVLYALLAAGAGWLGIGSIQCRRWARALTLVLACLGLATGLLAMVLMVSIFPSMATAMKGDIGDVPEAAAGITFALGCMLVAVAFFYLVIPGAFVLFYRSPHVKATCEHYDPIERWTDRVPLPVLAGTFLLLSLVTAVFAPVMGMPMPFFGDLLTGAPAWIYAFISGGIAAVVTWGFFRLERWAWLGAVLLMGLSGLSAYLSFSGDGLYRTYEEMGMLTEQIEEMQDLGILSSMPWIMGVSIVLMLAFYVWLGRYFGEKETTRAGL